MARLIDGKVIRTCRICNITSDLIAFWVSKDSRSGKYYTQNICIPCRREYNYSKKYVNVSKEEFCRKASEWNKKNRERINERRRHPWVLKGISQ
jgi:hypothetical protein